jgi:hypothetical protein
LLLWNPIGRQVEQYVHIPVPDGDSYVVMDGKGVQIAFQINPLYRNVLDIPGRSSTSTQELVFYVTLPPVGYAAYTIQSRKAPVVAGEELLLNSGIFSNFHLQETMANHPTRQQQW